ncbi:hypothetical protein EJD97_008538 [Solanum chilense]|uniref:Uncharacterized protein n=1 Tax=Solanum chilense TaxID=4083 RepID=A0A6N2BLR8_SOLCI|nr:hypothetical protein EJD97_008538 [Solanum chilense]
MEKSKAFLELTQEESDRVSSLDFLPIPTGAEFSLYECYALRGIRVDRLESDRVFCTFKVPPRLTNREGKLAAGAIANLIDAVGAGCVNIGGHPVNTSDELEIMGQVLGKKGGYSGTSVLVKNKATGELIAEGRHSLFGKYASKI